MKPDPVLFARSYLDMFDNEDFDGNGIKSMTVVEAIWGRGGVSGQMTDIVFAKVHYQNGEILTLECWSDNPPNVSAGHIFRDKSPTTGD